METNKEPVKKFINFINNINDPKITVDISTLEEYKHNMPLGYILGDLDINIENDLKSYRFMFGSNDKEYIESLYENINLKYNSFQRDLSDVKRFSLSLFEDTVLHRLNIYKPSSLNN